MTGAPPSGLTPAKMAAIHGLCFIVPRPWGANEIADLLASPPCFAIAEPSGFSLARVVADEAELLTLAVAPEARRRGLGRRLLGATVTAARRRGAETMLLEVASDNAAAIALYRGAGFVQLARRREYYRLPDGGATDALILRLPLAPAQPDRERSGPAS